MNFVSLYIYRSKTKQLLIIQITDQKLTIALAQKHNEQLHLTQHQTHALTMNEVKGSIIYNPTAIQRLIQQFIEQHHLKRPKLIICWPSASTSDITLLQQALCLSKHHVIEKLVTTLLIPELIPDTHTTQDQCPTWAAIANAPNVLDTLLPNGYHALPTWITLSGLAFGALFYGLTSMYTTTQHTITTTATACAQTADSNANMKTKVKTAHKLTEKNQALDAQLNMIRKHQAYTSTMQGFLVTVAQTIPPNSYLVDFTLHNNTEKAGSLVKREKSAHQKPGRTKPAYLRLSLKGVTYNPEEMSLFLKHLSEKVPNGHFALTNIQRITEAQTPHHKTKATYAFAISGLIPT